MPILTDPRAEPLVPSLRKATPDVLALAALAVYPALLLRKTVLGGGAMLGYDLFNYFFPAKTFFAASLARGEAPLWNPYIYFGAPYLANVQMAALYPPDLIFAILGFPSAVAISQWLHLWIAGAGMYALARWGWRLGPLAALTGGVAFAGSGFFAAHMGHLNQVHAGAWLPWEALCLWRLASAGGRRGPIWLVAGGAVVALQLTAGHTQEVYYSLFALGLLAVGFAVFPPAGAPRRLPHLLAFAGICINGTLLAAAQLLPAMELTRLSYRQGGIPIDEAVAYAVDRTSILETVLPTFWSLPNQEVTGYVGVTALVLAVAAVGVSPARRTALALLFLTALALTLALGVYTPLYDYLYRFVPLFNSFRAPGRWVLVSGFALAGLAALGADALRWRSCPLARERLAARFSFALTAAAAGLALICLRSNVVHAIQWLPHARVAVLWMLAGAGSAALALAGLFSPWPWPRLALVGVLALELAFAAHEAEYNRPGDSSLYSGTPPVVALFPASSGGADGRAESRVLSLAVEERLDPERFGRAVPTGDGDFKRYASMREALKPNLGVVYGLPTIDGYDGGLLPTRDYARFKSLLITGETPVPHLTLPPQVAGKADARLLAAFGVRYVLTDGREGAPGEGWHLREAAPGAAWLYENALGTTRVLFPDRVVGEPDPDEAARLLAGSDLTQLAVVSGPVDPAIAALGDAIRPITPPERRSTTVVDYRNHVVELRAEVDRPSLLVLTDSYYPGWRAAVDGQPVSIALVDGLFRGVVVPSGTHQVRFWFDPLSVKLGAAISCLAIAANVAALILWRRHVRPSR